MASISSSTVPRNTGKKPEAPSTMPIPDDTTTRVITPDLRALLSRTIYVVPKSQDSGVLWGHPKK